MSIVALDDSSTETERIYRLTMTNFELYRVIPVSREINRIVSLTTHDLAAHLHFWPSGPENDGGERYPLSGIPLSEF